MHADTCLLGERTRTLTVRLPDQAGGYQSRLWRDGWEGLRRAEEAGWAPGGPPAPAASVQGVGRQNVYGRPGDGGTLVFTFLVGIRGFAELVGQPRPAAIVTMDIATRQFLGVRFLNRPA